MRITNLLAATALAGSFALAAPAFAQAAPNAPNAAQPAPQTQDDVETARDTLKSSDGQNRDDGTVVVTGSRIARPETSGVLPGVQVTGAQIEARGFTNAVEALTDIPLTGTGAGFNGNNGGQAASLGAAFVDLLDLGTQRTLTLVNGRRFVSGNAASLFVFGNETGSQVDVSAIPSTLISRIDVLTVGGAATYGSDAIAGVVNFILKDDYDGIEARALSGLSDRRDAGQQQLSLLAGRNFAGGRGNITVSGEYTHLDGLQADARDFRLVRASTATNFLNGTVRNTGFAPGAIVDVANTNNGAFLRSTTDGQPGTIFGQGFINQSLSFNGTITNLIANPTFTPYTSLTTGTGATLRTSNYIILRNGLAPVGQAVPAVSATGAATTIAATNVSFYNSAAQIINGLPGVGLAVAANGAQPIALSGNGLNGRATPATGLTFTTFAPTALPAGVTAATVFAAFNVTPTFAAPARTDFGADATGTASYNSALATYNSNATTLAVNTLQANRSTAREFFAANPGVNVNYFIGTFDPAVPHIVNTDTTLVTIRSNANGGTIRVPVNQVLPYVAVPLEFNTDGSIRPYTFASGTTPSTVLTPAQAVGSNGGFARSIENIVLRTQQDRFIGNLLGKFDMNDEIQVFTENLYSHVKNVTVRNSPSQNFQSSTAENAPLILNVDNPFLTTTARAALANYGISPAVNGGYFSVTRQNQDIFGNNAYANTAETYRSVLGVRSNFQMLGHKWTAEVSGTYGRAKEVTNTTQIGDLEYQLALDAVDQGLATTGVANGNIVCRAQVRPGDYLGKTPVGTTINLTRQPGADGLPTEVIFQPTITQALIDSCKPLNPFGYNNMTDAAKAYVRQNVRFQNVAKQTFIQTQVGGGLFDLPAGALQVSASGEYRKEELAFTSDPLNRLGRGRSAPSANTFGQTETYEIGGEAVIPIFGPQFAPFLGTLEFNPSVRVSQQSGKAARFRNLAGQIVSPKAVGDPATIYSLAGTWRPIRDILLRGNYTKSVRNPSVVELFLGGQPSFTTPVDVCGPAQIAQGTRATTRTANCRADVIARGLATDAAGANTYLANFVPLTNALQGSFSGSPTLQPERGTSYTYGGVLQPRFLPGLSLSADYIHLNLRNIISPVSLGGNGGALQLCYDSATFPDTGPQTGTNTCGFFTRGADFQLQNGYASGFINLSAQQVRAINISGSYPLNLPFDAGKLRITGNAFHLIHFRDSASGDFTDVLESAGTFGRPSWEVQASGRYEIGGFYSQLTWNHQGPTRVFVSGVPAGVEDYPNSRFPSYDLFDLNIGADINKRFRIQAVVFNLTDKKYVDGIGLAAANGLGLGYIDQIGRRYQVAVTTRF